MTAWTQQVELYMSVVSEPDLLSWACIICIDSERQDTHCSQSLSHGREHASTLASSAWYDTQALLNHNWQSQVSPLKGN